MMGCVCRMDLKGKRVLLFTSVLFNYHIQIKKAIEDLGAEVHLYDERNDPSSMEKILIRKARFLMRRRTNAYYKLMCEREKDFKPNYVLFVSPEAVTEESLRMLRNTFSNSKFILYMWDSVKNKKVQGILKHFDSTFSFDPADCQQYGMTFRPLFFSQAFENNGTQEEYEYDVSFIGTVHSDRAKILWEIKEFCDENQLKYYFYLFIPGKLLFNLRMMTDPFLRKWDRSYIHIDSIGKEEVAGISEKTRCIIDINHPEQTGLTMRTIEMLGLNRKLATTNTNISSYDFYRPQNQIMLDRKHLALSKDMIREKYVKIPNEIYKKYSIQYWAKDIFGLND